MVGHDVGRQHDIGLGEEEDHALLNCILEVNHQFNGHSGTDSGVVGCALNWVDGEVALCTSTLRRTNASRGNAHSYNAVRRGLAGPMGQLARGILHPRKRQTGLAGVLWEVIPEDASAN